MLVYNHNKDLDLIRLDQSYMNMKGMGIAHFLSWLICMQSSEKEDDPETIAQSIKKKSALGICVIIGKWQIASSTENFSTGGLLHTRSRKMSRKAEKHFRTNYEF